ncbi:MAG TPA: hypothetical protein VKU41_27545 [Polyangiaceae bacterium]|nr:hypothetical protein [Polyangiaceae bacterium]
MIWTRAGLDDAARSGWPYIDLLHVAAGLARRRERALFIGCGGAVGPRQFAVSYPGIEIDVVESEDHVIELAKSFFGLDGIPRLTVHHAEGASFLEGALLLRSGHPLILETRCLDEALLPHEVDFLQRYALVAQDRVR